MTSDRKALGQSGLRNYLEVTSAAIDRWSTARYLGAITMRRLAGAMAGGRSRMFNRHVPDPIYRHLTAIYLITAALLVLAPLSPLKWIPIAALVIAAGLTFLLRHAPDRTSRGSVRP